MRKDYYWPLLLTGLLAGCGSSEHVEKVAKPPQETVFGDLVRAENKARSVEATTLQHKNDIDAAVQANEGAASAAE